jgi:cation:H+ antiporter
MVQSNIVRKELPLLLLIGLLFGYFIWDKSLTRVEAVLLLVGFFSLIGWSIFSAMRGKNDALESDMEQELVSHSMSKAKAIFWLLVGLVLLIVSSRVLVWGAVNIAHEFGVSDLVIGLTIVALGTSLPELAASIIAVRKGEHDIAIGNVVGSNMFNLLAVIGIAGVISPMQNLSADVLSRDWLVMMVMTVVLLMMAYGLRRPGRINRYEGAGLLLAFAAYNVWLVSSVIG